MTFMLWFYMQCEPFKSIQDANLTTGLIDDCLIDYGTELIIKRRHKMDWFYEIFWDF